MATYSTGVQYRGLNRAGAEYGDAWEGWTGQTFYSFPSNADLALELSYYSSKGFNILRLPVSWERLQHELKGELDATYANQVMSFVNQARAGGWAVIIDLHNYNRYATGAFDAVGAQVNTYAQQVFGEGYLDESHLADVWTRLTSLFVGNPNVVFNLMNEPHDFHVPAEDWFARVQKVIDAIRATGAGQLILVPNSRGSDVDHWDKYPPNGGALDSEAALAISDAAGNCAFDMHAYQDDPSSPTSYVDLVTPVTNWAMANGRQLFLSELGVQNGAANGAAALGNLLSYLNDNSDVWVGWTAWNLSPYNLTQPDSYTQDGPQMGWYTPYLTPGIVSL